jgi:hypothetical protein
MIKDRTHKRGAQRSPLSLLGVALLFAGCASGETGETGAGGHRPDGGAAPAAQLACSVAHDVALGTGQAEAPSIAFGGSKFAAAWIEQDGSVHAAVVDANGSIAGSHTIATAPHAKEPAVTALPAGGFVVVWQEPGALRAARIGADASLSGTPFTVAQTTAAEARPAAGGTTLVWEDTRGLLTGHLNLNENTNESMLHGSVAAAGPGATDPAVAVSDGTVGLVFTMGGKLGFAKLGSAQNVMPVIFRDWQGKVNVPRVSPAGKGGWFVTWEDARGGTGNETVYLSLIGADEKLRTPVAVPIQAGSADYPDVATLGNDAAVVYYQFRDGPPAVFLSVFGPDLKRLGEEVRISGHDPARFGRVAAGDGGLGVAYAQRSGPAHFARVTCH